MTHLQEFQEVKRLIKKGIVNQPDWGIDILELSFYTFNAVLLFSPTTRGKYHNFRDGLIAFHHLPEGERS